MMERARMKIEDAVTTWKRSNNGLIRIHIEGKESIQINSFIQQRAASTIKLLLAIEAFRQIDEGILALTSVIQRMEKNTVGGAGILRALPRLTHIKVEELLTLMIIVSDNTATNELISLVGFEKINECAKNLGLKKTVLNRYMMDEIAVEKGIDNYTCASDVVKCLREISEGNLLQKSSREKIMRMLEMQQFQHKLPARIGSAFQAANKTGELQGAEHDSAILMRGNETYYAVVLIDGLSDNEQGRRLIADIGYLLSSNI
ncbi:serine hydrolase [Priestia megaterium]|jgi:beta-lactamase class A|nr:serine hydrolase [Bacillus sp. T_4]PEE78606.1 serine hydrolase [Priestia megaterium]PET70887.1 serine hydrolase [Priestia megaterium]PFK85642.1 serine hydrolase [Priestia megaterium]PGX44952.1 serine hydrolase [Priestia megaterium]